MDLEEDLPSSARPGHDAARKDHTMKHIEVLLLLGLLLTFVMVFALCIMADPVPQL
jgi:hypothetical protein